MECQQLYETLVQRYLNNTASKEELELFFHLLQEGKLDAYLEKIPLTPAEATAVVSKARKEKAGKRSFSFLRYAVAASLILIVSAGLLLVQNQKKAALLPEPRAQIKKVPQAAPGSTKAVLTLSDGREVALDKQNQTIRDGNAAIVVKNNGLVYQSNVSTERSYNTITTPKGGEYRLTLPDGSKVWLNAESSLRYPTIFGDADREVALSGEAYFEVARSPGQPFLVHTKGAVVKVLGTHFNVMAYDDESYMKTTLEEGAVVVQKNGREERLRPGEGGMIADGSTEIVVAEADVAQDLAWKNGGFYFNKTELSIIMKQIARWYGLEVRYTGPVPKKRFVGKISRNTNLSDVLDVLRLSDIKFSMTGNTLIVEE